MIPLAQEQASRNLTLTQQIYAHVAKKVKRAGEKVTLDETTTVYRDPSNNRTLMFAKDNIPYAKIWCPCGGARAMQFLVPGYEDPAVSFAEVQRLQNLVTTVLI